MPKRTRSGVITPVVQEVEQLLRQYLQARGWREGVDWVWEQIAFDGKKPDAVLLDELGKPRAVYEATSLDAEPLLECVQHANKAPTDRSSGRAHVSFGSPTLTDVVQRKASLAQSVASAGIPFMLVTDATRLGQQSAEALVAYPEFSAIATIAKANPFQLIPSLSREASHPREGQLIESLRGVLVQQYDYDPLHPPEQAGEIVRRLARVPVMEAAVMDIYLNPQARSPWTRDLWGVYDTVWQWEEQAKQYSKIYDGRWELLKTYRLFLRAGRFAVPVKEGVSTSRSENFYEERE